MTEQEMQFELMKSQEKVNALRQEVAAMNKEREYWQQVRIQMTAVSMREIGGLLFREGYEEGNIAKRVIKLADALVTELRKKGGQDD